MYTPFRYKLSVRNTVGAKAKKIERGDASSLVRMASASPVKLTSIISNEAFGELGLYEGDQVKAMFKSTEIMITKPLRFPTKKEKQAQMLRMVQLAEAFAGISTFGYQHRRLAQLTNVSDRCSESSTNENHANIITPYGVCRASVCKPNIKTSLPLPSN